MSVRKVIAASVCTLTIGSSATWASTHDNFELRIGLLPILGIEDKFSISSAEEAVTSSFEYGIDVPFDISGLRDGSFYDVNQLGGVLAEGFKNTELHLGFSATICPTRTWKINGTLSAVYAPFTENLAASFKVDADGIPILDIFYIQTRYGREYDGFECGIGVDLSTDMLMNWRLLFRGQANPIGNGMFDVHFDRMQVNIDIAPVPIPASGWLLLAGFGGLAGIGYRRRRNA